MAGKRIICRPGVFGYAYYYDEQGNCIGKSRPNLFGDGKDYYNSRGTQVGKSHPGLFGEEYITLDIEDDGEERVPNDRLHEISTLQEENKTLRQAALIVTALLAAGIIFLILI